jgi:hypothetical protein
MGLSNYLPNSRISQAGVCTSSTRPVSPYEGQVIYETDTNRTLVWDNAAWVDPSTGQTERSGLVSVTPTSVSGTGVTVSGSTIDLSGSANATINGVFTNKFDFYRIYMFIQGSSSQVSLSGQFTISGTATNTNYTYQTLDAYSTTIAASLQSSQAQFLLGNTTTNVRAPFVYDVFFPNNNTTTHILSMNHNYNAFPDMLGFRAIRHTAAAQFDGIRLAISAGTMTGSVQVFGLNKL